MKNKTDISEEFLLKAIQHLPESESLMFARSQMNNALKEIRESHKKKVVQPQTTPQQRWQETLSKIRPNQAKEALAQLDKLIAIEEESLKEKPTNDQFLRD